MSVFPLGAHNDVEHGQELSELSKRLKPLKWADSLFLVTMS